MVVLEVEIKRAFFVYLAKLLQARRCVESEWGPEAGRTSEDGGGCFSGQAAKPVDSQRASAHVRGVVLARLCCQRWQMLLWILNAACNWQPRLVKQKRGEGRPTQNAEAAGYLTCSSHSSGSW